MQRFRTWYRRSAPFAFATLCLSGLLAGAGQGRLFATCYDGQPDVQGCVGTCVNATTAITQCTLWTVLNNGCFITTTSASFSCTSANCGSPSVPEYINCTMI